MQLKYIPILHIQNAGLTLMILKRYISIGNIVSAPITFAETNGQIVPLTEAVCLFTITCTSLAH